MAQKFQKSVFGSQKKFQSLCYLYLTLLTNEFAEHCPRAKETKEKINKWDYIKIKSFCITKETTIKMNMESTVWEDIFVNETSDKD